MDIDDHQVQTNDHQRGHFGQDVWMILLLNPSTGSTFRDWVRFLVFINVSKLIYKFYP